MKPSTCTHCNRPSADLKTHQRWTREGLVTHRHCPVCRTELDRIALGMRPALVAKAKLMEGKVA